MRLVVRARQRGGNARRRSRNLDERNISGPHLHRECAIQNRQLRAGVGIARRRPGEAPERDANIGRLRRIDVGWLAHEFRDTLVVDEPEEPSLVVLAKPPLYVAIDLNRNSLALHAVEQITDEVQIALVGDDLRTQGKMRLVKRTVALLEIARRHRAFAHHRDDATLAKRPRVGYHLAVLISKERHRPERRCAVVKRVKPAEPRGNGPLFVDKAIAGGDAPFTDLDTCKRRGNTTLVDVVRREEKSSSAAHIRLERGDINVASAV